MHKDGEKGEPAKDPMFLDQKPVVAANPVRKDDPLPPVKVLSAVHHAILLSCSGWRLNKLPEVKAFIAEASQFKSLEVKYVGGDPRFVFYDSEGKQVGDEVNVASYKKDEIHALLTKKGLERKKP